MKDIHYTCNNHLTMYLGQIIMLYTLNVHSAVCLFYLNKTWRKKPQTSWGRSLKFRIDVAAAVILPVCVFPLEICLHRTLWESGTGAQVGAVAHLHGCECREHRTVPSAHPHAPLHPSRWVLSRWYALHAALQLRPRGLRLTQVKAERGHINVEYSDDLNGQWFDYSSIWRQQGNSTTFSFSWDLIATGGPPWKDSVFSDRCWQQPGALGFKNRQTAFAG